MGKKHKSYTATEKYKIVLETIRGNLTQAEITAKYKGFRQTIFSWSVTIDTFLLRLF